MILLLSACFIGGGDRVWTVPAEQSAVQLFVDNGSLSVLPGVEGEVRIEWSGGGISTRPPPRPMIDGDSLVFDARCGEACGGDVIAWVPPGVDIQAQVSKGSLELLHDAPGDLDVCVATGDLSLEVPGGAWNLDLRVGVGSLRVLGLDHDPQAARSLRACVAAGDLEAVGF